MEYPMEDLSSPSPSSPRGTSSAPPGTSAAPATDHDPGSGPDPAPIGPATTSDPDARGKRISMGAWAGSLGPIEGEHDAGVPRFLVVPDPEPESAAAEASTSGSGSAGVEGSAVDGGADSDADPLAALRRMLFLSTRPASEHEQSTASDAGSSTRKKKDPFRARTDTLFHPSVIGLHRAMRSERDHARARGSSGRSGASAAAGARAGGGAVAVGHLGLPSESLGAARLRGLLYAAICGEATPTGGDGTAWVPPGEEARIVEDHFGKFLPLHADERRWWNWEGMAGANHMLGATRREEREAFVPAGARRPYRDPLLYPESTRRESASGAGSGSGTVGRRTSAAPHATSDLERVPNLSGSPAAERNFQAILSARDGEGCWRLNLAQAVLAQRAEPRGGVRERRRGMICGKSLARGERCYNCKTCGVDSSCVMCSDCYFASDHAGHDVSYGIAFSFSGYCDCGDPDAWLAACSCALHPAARAEDAPTDHPERGAPSSSNPKNVPLPLAKLSAKQFAVHTELIDLALDYIIDTLRYSPADTSAALPKTAADVLKIAEHSGQNGGMPAAGKDVEMDGGDSDLATGPADAPFRSDAFALILWADEKHTAREVSRQLGEALGGARDTVSDLMLDLERKGRAVVLVTDRPSLLLHVAHTLARIDLGVTIRPAYDTHRELIVTELIGFLADLCESSCDGDALYFRRLIMFSLNRRYRPWMDSRATHEPLHPPETERRGLEMWGEIIEKSRTEWLFLLFSRLWKGPRTQLMGALVRILTTDTWCKKVIGCNFARVYHRLVDQYIFTDREPELNLLLWGMQLFPIPSLAEEAVCQQGLLDRLIQILLSYFTEQHNSKRMFLPPRGPIHIDADSQSFRTKKWQTISSHLKALLHSPGVQRALRPTSVNATVPSDLVDIIDFLQLFTGMAPQRRAVDTHIEYESDSWVRALGVSMDLSRMTAILGQGWATATRDEVIAILDVVSRRIMQVASQWLVETSPLHYKPLTMHQVNTLCATQQVIRFDVASEWVSIHNPLHYLYGELLKHAPRVIDVSSGGGGSGVEWTASLQEEGKMRDLQAVIEYPLRTVAYLAQVRAGLWVRNGIGMRGQLHHYRENPLRETTYDQDLIILQYGFTALPHDVMLLSIIDRFGLIEFFQGNAWTRAGDTIHQSQMVEEFLLLILHLFSETAAIMGWTREDVTRREIVQQLCLGPLAYSDLVKRLSERTVDVPSFAEILDTVATLRQPRAVSETGVYELRSECYAEVNPLFYHYTRNQQGEAYEILVNRRKKEDPSAFEPVVLPRQISLPPAPKAFSNLADIFARPFIMRICYFAIHNVINSRAMWPTGSDASKAGPQADGILDLALHLCLLALVQDESHSAIYACVNHGGVGTTTLLRHLCDIEHDPEYRLYRPRVTAILNMVAQHQQSRVNGIRRRADPSAQPAVSGEDARKAAVKARQQAILAGFAKNQQQFMDNYYDGEDDTDDDMDTSTISHGPCIVCQEECSPARPSGLLACVQPSTVMRSACHERAWFTETLRIPTTLDRDTRVVTYGFGTDGEPEDTDAYPKDSRKFGLHASACGHLMHEDCLAKFFRDTELRQSLQGQRNHPENAYRREFVCPLCKSIGNVLVPLDAPARSKASNGTAFMPLNDWIRRISDESLRNVRDPGRLWDQHLSTGELMPWFALSVEHIAATVKSGGNAICQRFASIIAPISTQTAFLHGRNDSGLYMPETLVAHTISMIEISNRGQAPGKDGAGNPAGLPDATVRLLRGLLTILTTYVDMAPGSIREPSCRRVTVFARFLPDWFRNNRLTSALLLRDPLTLVVEAAAMCPDILQPVIVLAYYAELTRTMLAMAFWAKKSLADLGKNRPAESPEQDETAADAHGIFAAFRPIAMTMFRHSPQLHHEAASFLSLLTDAQISRLLYVFTLPFLRRCAILKQLVGPAGFPTTPRPENPRTCEYNRLLFSLGVPSPRSVLAESTSPTSTMISTWLQPWAQSQPILPFLEWPGIYEMYRLPRALEDLLRCVRGKRCKTCGTEPSSPAMCYVCGEFLCIGNDCCAEGELGEANQHRMSCGGPAGIFIDLKRWAVVYLYAGSGSYGPMPFLDAHGELDQAMRRGHPQYQYQPRADELRRTWLNHGVASFVARRLELSLDQGGWGSL